MRWHDLHHDTGLAWHSLRRTPALSGLMIATMAVGIAASMIAITLHHARTGRPIPWKQDTLYAVALDARDAKPQPFERHPDYPPFQLTVMDARALYASKIPVHAVMMYRAGRTLTPAAAGMMPFPVDVRVTTADFFAAFDVPFLHGSGWTRADDDTPAAVVVISRFLNQKLFAGGNSVGRTVVIEDIPYRVIGVLDSWMPQPRYYDLSGGTGFDIPEDVFLPFGWMQAQQIMPNGDVYFVNDHGANSLDDFKLFTATDCCALLQYWVELRGRADRDRFQDFVDSYTDEQRRKGRFPRPNNNRIVDVPTWLSMWDVVGDVSRLQLLLGLAFLAVCILNTLGMMLARFLRAAPIAGLRRALGARRIDIIRQHLLEALLVGVLGGALGVALTIGGLAALWGLLYSDTVAASGNPDQATVTQALVHMDFTVLAWAVALSILTGLLAGLYPAWRIGRLPPAMFLKAQ